MNPACELVLKKGVSVMVTRTAYESNWLTACGLVVARRSNPLVSPEGKKD